MPKQMRARMTARQRRFITEYLVDFNATNAAIRAGYSGKTAAQKGWQLINWRPAIAEAIRDQMKVREPRMLITADRALEGLARIAFADIRRLLETGPDGKTRVKPIESLSETEAAAIAEVSVSEKGAVRIKLRDSRAALLDIARHFGVLDKPRNGAPGEPAKDEIPAREILRRKLAQMAAAEKE